MTSYTYDAIGNVLVTTDVLGRETRTFYDALNRAEGTISNWDGTVTLADDRDDNEFSLDWIQLNPDSS